MFMSALERIPAQLFHQSSRNEIFLFLHRKDSILTTRGGGKKQMWDQAIRFGTKSCAHCSGKPNGMKNCLALWNRSKVCQINSRKIK